MRRVSCVRVQKGIKMHQVSGNMKRSVRCRDVAGKRKEGKGRVYRIVMLRTVRRESLNSSDYTKQAAVCLILLVSLLK